MGPEVAEIEKRFSDYVGAKHAVSYASGTDALLMALMALNVGPGDAVFTTPFTPRPLYRGFHWTPSTQRAFVN